MLLSSRHEHSLGMKIHIFTRYITDIDVMRLCASSSPLLICKYDYTQRRAFCTGTCCGSINQLIGSQYKGIVDTPWRWPSANMGYFVRYRCAVDDESHRLNSPHSQSNLRIHSVYLSHMTGVPGVRMAGRLAI